MELGKEDQVSIIKYLTLFYIVYLVVNLTVSAILDRVEVDSVPGLSTVIVVICAAYIAKNFVSHQGRAPNERERRQLSLGALMVSYLVSASMLVIYTILLDMNFSTYLEILEIIPAWLWLILVVIVSALYFLTFYYIFGPGARRMAGYDKN